MRLRLRQRQRGSGAVASARQNLELEALTQRRKVAGTDDIGLVREHFLDQDAVDLRIVVGHGIGQDEDAVVLVTGGGQYDAGGGDARQDQGVDAKGAQP
jgi:hypothetical protein